MASHPIRNAIFPLLLAGLTVGGCAEPERRGLFRDAPQPSARETTSFGIPWETEFAHVQGVKAVGLIFVAGQYSLDETGVLVGAGNMEAQMRRAYANVKRVLERFHATMDDVLEETLLVTEMLPVLTVAQQVRQDIYGRPPTVASTIVQVQRLAFKDALIAVRVTARAQPTAPAPGSGKQTQGLPGRRGGGRRPMGGMGGGGSPY